MTGNGWLRMIAENPGHSNWYIERFRSLAASGHDLDGEARFVDAIAPRQAAILDAGCGPGRVGGRLATLGHQVVGVDIDPALIAAANSLKSRARARIHGTCSAQVPVSSQGRSANTHRPDTVGPSIVSITASTDTSARSTTSE